MLGSTSYSSEEDQDHARSSPSDLPQPPQTSLSHLQFHLITTTPPLLAASSSSSQVIHPRQLLITCAELISRTEYSSANRLLNLLTTDFASQFGDSIERLVYYFCKALNERLNRHLSTTFITNPNDNTPHFLGPRPPLVLYPHQPNINVTLLNQQNNPRPPILTPLELISPIRYSSYLSLNQVTPFVRFTHLTANQAILEVVESYSAVHILDMEIMHGVQWPPLLQAIVERSATLGHPPPTIRITGAGWDPSLLEMTGDRLRKFAESLGLEFEFHLLVLHNSEIIDHSEVVSTALRQQVIHRQGLVRNEALAVNCGDYLHRLLREYDTRSLRRFLHTIKALNPKVLTVGERQSDHNHPLFVRRFTEAMDHYGAIFDSLEATLPPQSQERVAVEEGWFGEEVKDVIGEEGERRRERHQKYETWEVLLRSSGFKSVALSAFSLSQAKLLLRLHYPSEGYQLQVVNNNCLMLGWKNRPLFSVSSWQ